MISSSSAEADTNEMIMIPLKDTSFISLLRTFRRTLKSSVGHNGYLKLIVTGGGYINLSSSSSLILQHYDQLGSPIIQFIAQIMKNQSDFGLYCGLMISSILEHLLSLQNVEKITPKESISEVNFIIDSCNEIFNSNLLKIPVNFDSITSFIPIVQSVLKSKCKLFFNDVSSSELCIQIIKAFLYALDVDRSTLGKVKVLVFKGNEEYKFHPGVMYQLTESDHWIRDLTNQFICHKSILKALLFTTMLDDDKKFCYTDNENINKIFKILEEAIKLNVNIIACQKVVNSDFKLFLRRKSIIVLERMGTDLAYSFEQLSGAFPISSIDKVSLSDIPNMIGVIDNINLVDVNLNSYLVMERNCGSVATLIVKTPCLAGTQQIKVLVEQALIVLSTLATCPFVCPGAGCFESHLFIHLQAMYKKKKIGDDIKWLFTSLMEASGNSLPIWIDTIYNHAWSAEDQLNCNCQLVSKNMISNFDGSLNVFSVTDESSAIVCESKTFNAEVYQLSTSAIVDSFVLKRSSLISALESCINLLSIGTVLYKK